jgi:hypothetical protein
MLPLELCGGERTIALNFRSAIEQITCGLSQRPEKHIVIIVALKSCLSGIHNKHIIRAIP